MKKSILIASLILSNQISAGCFKQHLADAIEINKSRQPIYSKLTNQESEKISSILIKSEIIAQLFALFSDNKASYWQDHNIPILCNDFASMDNTKPISTNTLPGPNELLIILDSAELKSSIEFYFKLEGLAGVEKYSDHLIKKLQHSPNYNCMQRHVLESINVFARHGQKYVEQATSLEIETPEKFIWKIINQHLLTIGISQKIDKLAYNIQKSGISIVCADVPTLLNL